MDTMTSKKNGTARIEQPVTVVPVAQPEAAKKPPVRWLPRLLSVLLLLAVLGGGAAWGRQFLNFAGSHEGTDDAFIDGHVVNVASRVAGPIIRLHVTDNQLVHKGDVLAEIDPSDFQTQLMRAQAQLESSRRHLKAAQIQVQVTRVTSAADVDQASSGVSVATSNEQQFVTAVDTAGSQVETARARLEQARVQVTVARRNEDEARAQVAAAAAGADNAHSDMLRMQQLFDMAAVSQQELDHATNAWRTATAQLEAARKRLDSQAASTADAQSAVQASLHLVQQSQSQVVEAQAKVQQAHAQIGQAQGRLSQARVAPHQVALTQADVDVAASDVKVAEAAVAQAKLNLSYTKLYAAQDGRVTRRSIEAGSYVQVGQPLLALVAPNVWVTANFKETQLKRIRVGQAVAIKVDAYPDHVFPGHVESFQAGSGAAFSLLPPENATGNYVKVVQRIPVKIVFDQLPDSHYVLGPGMSVEPEVVLQ